MSLSKRKKIVKEERKICNPAEVCLKCGDPIKKSKHHFFYNACWVPGLMYSEEIKKKIKEMKKNVDV
jgi:hypothetical protein